MSPIDAPEHTGADCAGDDRLHAMDPVDSLCLVVSSTAFGLLLLDRTDPVHQGISQRSRIKGFGFCFNLLPFDHDVYLDSLQCTVLARLMFSTPATIP